MMDKTKETQQAPRKRKTWTTWLKRALGGLLALAVVLSLAGLIYQATASRSDRRAHAPPGELVDVGDRRLHIVCSGSGTPTIVLEAALGETWISWSLVFENIAAFTRVCAYDRAGLGWSDPARGRRTSGQVADDLHRLLEGAAVPGPYVLVGHSIGGVYVRAYAERYPDDVAGLVLLDASHDQQTSRMPPEIGAGMRSLNQFLTVCRLLSPFGVPRIADFHGRVARSTPLSPDDQETYLATMNRTSFCTGLQNDLATTRGATSREDPPSDLGDLPLVVMTAGKRMSEADPAELPPGVDAEVAEEADETWMALQRELAELSSNGEWVVAEESGHYPQYDQPRMVVQVIKVMVE
jgi:pimeloyl-ACP methyl ester carboxylesterase